MALINIHATFADEAASTALALRLTQLSEKFQRKAIIGLHEPIINSHMLPKGFYLSQYITLQV